MHIIIYSILLITRRTYLISLLFPPALPCAPSPKIILRFSAPVAVTGAPVLKLETGVIDREAVWVDTTQYASGVGDDDDAVTVAAEVESDDFLLLFEYVVVTGDSAGDLDYWADEEASKLRLFILCWRFFLFAGRAASRAFHKRFFFQFRRYYLCRWR